ncbi:hypothetical protein MDG893_12149 [Marinobacter algicola DG893]|uniref:Uncharacterized protein n=1 Tax=Marinobacter algicola DG893 TaxID=443152 RepID=A6F4W0_9GAMM|nr:hypothetical protein MDG893_12149 [Marinobacter algicola DG893]
MIIIIINGLSRPEEGPAVFICKIQKHKSEKRVDSTG